MIRLAIFASGNGSNAENLYHYFKNHPSIKVALIVCNKPDAGVVNRARKLKIPLVIAPKRVFEQSELVLQTLKSEQIDCIILAGFLLKITENILKEFNNKIINIHPALLPKFGGKGMYGMHVHEAVIAAKEIVSGITVHYVNEHYDEGPVIAQFSVPVASWENACQLAEKIHALEMEHFPSTIEKVLTQNNAIA